MPWIELVERHPKVWIRVHRPCLLDGKPDGSSQAPSAEFVESQAQADGVEPRASVTPKESVTAGESARECLLRNIFGLGQIAEYKGKATCQSGVCSHEIAFEVLHKGHCRGQIHHLLQHVTAHDPCIRRHF